MIDPPGRGAPWHISMLLQGFEGVANRYGAAACPSSRQDCRRTDADDHSASDPMIAATARSGQRLPVPNTPSAASITAKLPMASLREHSHTERMLASPSR